MTNYVLDTNIVSFILREDATVKASFRRASTPQSQFLGCPVVWYEVRRGLLAQNATRQLMRFSALFSTFTWQDYTLRDWELAAELWAQRRAQGRPAPDADLLNGVFARNRDAVLVTDNEKDFVGLGLTIENWLKD